MTIGKFKLLPAENPERRSSEELHEIILENDQNKIHALREFLGLLRGLQRQFESSPAVRVSVESGEIIVDTKPRRVWRDTPQIAFESAEEVDQYLKFEIMVLSALLTGGKVNKEGLLKGVAREYQQLFIAAFDAIKRFHKNGEEDTVWNLEQLKDLKGYFRKEKARRTRAKEMRKSARR